MAHINWWADAKEVDENNELNYIIFKPRSPVEESDFNETHFFPPLKKICDNIFLVE